MCIRVCNPCRNDAAFQRYFFVNEGFLLNQKPRTGVVAIKRLTMSELHDKVIKDYIEKYEF